MNAGAPSERLGFVRRGDLRGGSGDIVPGDRAKIVRGPEDATGDESIVTWRDIAITFGPLAAVPIVLIGSTLWMRRYVLRSAAADPDVAWFSYARFL